MAGYPTEKPRLLQQRGWRVRIGGLFGLVFVAVFISHHSNKSDSLALGRLMARDGQVIFGGQDSPYGSFPQPDDPFVFIPCTNTTTPPDLADSDPKKTWWGLFDPDPTHWMWGNKTSNVTFGDDPYANRGIYLCGYVDLPLDYTNQSDKRITRLSVTKLQMSGLARVATTPVPGAGQRSNRTIVINPGGPGGSGVSYVFRSGEAISKRLSNSTLDVLGWDPRGVNNTQPALSCYPYDADRDRWSMLAGQYREATAAPEQLLELADAMNNATFAACRERHGDLGRFVSTAFVARDLEELRTRLGEPELTAFLVSYGTGIGQTWANMFPGSVGRVILDGTEYVRDQRQQGGFGWAALDNVTAAWRDGFLGECLSAGPKHCALAQERGGVPVTLPGLEDRMDRLITSLILRPVPGYLKSSGPSLVTYSAVVASIYSALYNAGSWPALAKMLYELEDGNSTLATSMLEGSYWAYNPTKPSPPAPKPATSELSNLVICADQYDAPDPPEGIAWWSSLWANMTAQSWIAGNDRFLGVFPCRHFARHVGVPAEVYRGDLGNALRNPVLLVAETYDPATPLRNGRRLLAEMGRANARLVAHHGYGHSSRDTSACTDGILRRYITTGEVPEETETACYADEKPYRYGVKAGVNETGVAAAAHDYVEEWREHVEDLLTLNPRLAVNLMR